MKPRIERKTYSGRGDLWSVSLGQFEVVTPCFALACCYAATGELYRRWPELKGKR